MFKTIKMLGIPKIVYLVILFAALSTTAFANEIEEALGFNPCMCICSFVCLCVCLCVCVCVLCVCVRVLK